ncbi:MAG: hypothetical protein ACFE8M_03885 [Candidatus Hermodarchaeota archaeon]
MKFIEKMLERTILFDLFHNEMLDINENDFSDFLNLLKRFKLKIKKNENKNLTSKLLENVDILVIGNPIDDYFSNIEIIDICNYVRIGGSLLLISEYGADYLQKTNLNDLSGTNFGIFFEKNLVKELNSNNQNSSSITHVQNFQENEVSNNLREIVIGGACSLFLNKNSKPLILSNKENVWSEIFKSSKEQWVKDKEQQQILAAYTEFGQGKIIAIGDIDIFTNDINIGINAMDNHLFLQNCLEWLLKPVEKSNVFSFTLNQLGTIQNEIKELNNTINNMIETMTILEKRISILEEGSSKDDSDKKI